MNATVKPGKLIKGQTGDWEVVIGLEVHAQVTSKSKLFSGASTEFGGEPNSHVSLVDAAMPGMLPVINEECVRQAVTDRARPQCADQPALGVRPQELFLCGFAAGLPDQPVQIAGRRRGRGRGRTGRRQDRHDRDRAAASGAGCRQVAARPVADHVLCRPQPLRRGADGDRVETRHPRRRAGQGLCDQAALDPALSRHLRRRHGEGLAARRCERVRAQAGRPARHPLRNQEHELDHLHRPGDRVRGAAPDRDHRGWRHDRPGDAAVRPQQGRDALAALQGRSARLSLFPGSRPAAAGIHARPMSTN